MFTDNQENRLYIQKNHHEKILFDFDLCLKLLILHKL